MVWLTKSSDGGGYISLSKDGDETVVLSTPSAGGRFSIYNRTGTRVCYLGAQDNRDGNLSVYNAGGTRMGGVPINF